MALRANREKRRHWGAYFGYFRLASVGRRVGCGMRGRRRNVGGGGGRVG